MIRSVTPIEVFYALLMYGVLFIVIRTYGSRIHPEERKTFWVVGLIWAVCVFVANYLLYLLGAMSFLPWVNNFLHTFVWIGFCLTWLYLAVRDKYHPFVQFTLFFVFSLVVKVGEHIIFGTWEHGHFWFVLDGHAFYVIGWSLADGLYPAITKFGLRGLSKVFSGLVLDS